LRYTLIYPLVICCIAIENGPFVVPIKDGDFPVRKLFVYQAGYVHEIIPTQNQLYTNLV